MNLGANMMSGYFCG